MREAGGIPGRPARRRRAAPTELRGSAFGLLAAIRSGGNLAASALAGLLWSAASPTIAFVFLAVAMSIALLLIATTRPAQASS